MSGNIGGDVVNGGGGCNRCWMVQRGPVAYWEVLTYYKYPMKNKSVMYGEREVNNNLLLKGHVLTKLEVLVPSLSC